MGLSYQVLVSKAPTGLIGDVIIKFDLSVSLLKRFAKLGHIFHHYFAHFIITI